MVFERRILQAISEVKPCMAGLVLGWMNTFKQKPLYQNNYQDHLDWSLALLCVVLSLTTYLFLFFCNYFSTAVINK